MPCNPCGPASSPDSTALSAGSTTKHRRPGLRGFNARAMPVMVPPVPAPPTTMSTAPSVSVQISSAVVASCAAGLAGLSNWRGIQAPGVCARIASARAIAPAMPCRAGVSCTSAPISRSILRRSMEAPSGMVTISR